MPDGEAFSVPHHYLRLTACPPLSSNGQSDACRQLGAFGTIASDARDPDLRVSIVAVDLDVPKWKDALAAAGRLLAPFAPDRLLRIEGMSSDAPALPVAEDAASMGRALEKALQVPVIASIRTVRSAQWSRLRAFSWGRRGMAANGPAGPQQAGAPDRLGASLEFGTPTLIYKIRLEGVPGDGVARACRAVGGPGGGFADVGAYASISAVDGEPIIVLEMEDDSRAPLHRVLDVVDIECARAGGRLGRAALLSHLPLDVVLAAMRAKAALDVRAGQIIETHLPAGPGDPVPVKGRT